LRTDGVPDQPGQVVGRRRQGVELVEREPARLVRLADHPRFEGRDADEVTAVRLPAEARFAEKVPLTLEQERAELELLHTELLAQFASQSVLVALAGIDAAARRDPPLVVARSVAQQQHALLGVDDDRAHGPADRQSARATGELLEPVQADTPRDSRVRGRRRRQDEQPRRPQPARLHPELRPLAEQSAVCLLADERDPLGPELARDALDACEIEVAAAQVAGAGRRARRGVRDPDAVLQGLELLHGLVQPRREARCVQQSPEVVARIREVRTRRIRDASGIDPAEDDPQPRREDVGNRARRLRSLGRAVRRAAPRAHAGDLRRTRWDGSGGAGARA
jgi:hypothetical protein